MSHFKVKSLFEIALAEYAATKGIRVAYDNVKFTATTNETYLQTHLMPADTFTDTMSGDHTAYIGVFQIKIIIGSGKSVKVVSEISTELQNIFKTYKVFREASPSTFSVQVFSPFNVPEGKVIDGSWIVPCYFQYRADTD